MLQHTLTKFNYPASLIWEYKNWYLLVRPMQVTLGCMVLINKNQNITTFGMISKDETIEMIDIISDLEKGLHDYLQYDKINYLMLMMSDPEVHFHIIPRYQNPRLFSDITFTDQSFPTAPDLSKFTTLTQTQLTQLATELKNYIQ